MTKRILPTPEQLRELLTYDPETGKLYWKPRPASMFPSDRVAKSWNTRYAGKEALTAKPNGYYQGNILSNNYVKAHRVAWAIFHGNWPEGDIDHANMRRDDNRIVNLRVASRSQNCMNTSATKSSKSGYKGVYFHSRVKKWTAQIGVNRKQYHLGYFASAQLAHAAYCEAAKKYHGEFARTT